MKKSVKVEVLNYLIQGWKLKQVKNLYASNKSIDEVERQILYQVNEALSNCCLELWSVMSKLNENLPEYKTNDQISFNPQLGDFSATIELDLTESQMKEIHDFKYCTCVSKPRYVIGLKGKNICIICEKEVEVKQTNRHTKENE